VDKIARKRVGEQIQWHLDRVNEYSRALSLGFVDIGTIEERLHEVCPFNEEASHSRETDLLDS
jgi:hypothetical protein